VFATGGVMRGVNILLSLQRFVTGENDIFQSPPAANTNVIYYFYKKYILKSYCLVSVLVIFLNISLSGQELDYSINNQIVSSLADNISIVGLGDPTHQESTITKYRIDLIKKLVKEKGFKIIAIEGNFFEIYEAHRDFIKTKNITLYEKAMFSQLNSTEMEDIYNFVFEENKAGNPIYFIGFDVAFSGSTFAKRVEEKLINSPIFTNEEKKHFIKLLKRASNTSLSAVFRNPSRLKKALKPYLEKIISQSKPENESDFFFLQAIQNLFFYLYSEEAGKGDNRRDYAMSQNLTFIRNYFANEKIIIFGSSTHLLKNPTNIQNKYNSGIRISFGEELNKKYGKAYYLIAYTALSGTKYNPFGKPFILSEPTENSIEKYIGKRYEHRPIYLRSKDFEGTKPMESRFLGHSFELFELWKVFDALILIDDVKPFKIKKQ
jgi:erythromycin esterase-like protein